MMEETDDFSGLPALDLPVGILNLVKRTEAGTALLAAAMLEDWLQRLILCAGREISNAIARNLFETYGPLHSFSAKIEIAYLFRLLNAEIYKDLKAIKSIRNRFAHSIELLHFSSSEIEKLCQPLTGWKAGGDNRTLFLGRAQACLDQTKAEIEKIMLAEMNRDFSAQISNAD
jgi:DNA-binding MltR family transcriptional regulator